MKEAFFALIREYGGAGICVGLILEYIGLPVPGESMLLLLGFFSGGLAQTAVSATLAVLGTFTGSMTAYAVGYRWGKAVVLKLGRPFHITEESLAKIDVPFRKHKAFYIIVSRFIPGARHIVPYLSGIGRIPFWRNAAYNLVSSLIWCGAFICLGNFAGSNWLHIGKSINTYSLVGLALLVFVFVVFRYFGRFKVPILAFSAVLTAFILFSSELLEQELSPMDTRVYTFLSKLISEDLTDGMKLISDMGSVYVLCAIAVILPAALWRKKAYRYYGAMTAVNLLSASLLNLIFKTLFHRARPDILRLVSSSGYSFPSGHSMVGAALYGYLIFLSILFLPKPWKQILPVPLFALILLIGISRVYLGVHYASDVIGGFLMGFSWLILFVTLIWTFDRNRRITPAAPVSI